MNDIIDSFVTLGRPAVPVGMPYLTPDALIQEMDRLGIRETFCADFRALEASADQGNRVLCETLKDFPRLHPVWLLLPASTGEMAPLQELVRDMAANRVRLVRAEPARFGFSMREWCSGALWSALEQKRIPVLLDINEQWDQLEELLRSHPDLPVILARVGYRCTRMLYPLLKAHHNLHFELSSFLDNEGLLETVGRFGSTRILFATDSPRFAPESALGTLKYAGLSPEDYSNIACGNIRRLTGLSV